MVETAERERMWRHAAAAAAVLALHVLIVLPLLYHAAPPPLPVQPTLITVDLTASEKKEAPAPKPVEIPDPVLPQPVIRMPVMPHPKLPSLAPAAKPVMAAPSAPARPAAAVPSEVISSSSNVVKESYTAKLRAWLAAHKRYPLQARRMRIKGSTILQLSVAPDGHVVAHRIERSTGSDILDREVEAMLMRSEPLPAPPPELAGGDLEFRFPIRFDPGEFD